MGFSGAFGVVASMIGFAVLAWMIWRFNKEISLVKIFTPPSRGSLSDWVGWIVVVGFLLFFFFGAVNIILTGENGCGPNERVNRWGDCV